MPISCHFLKCLKNALEKVIIETSEYKGKEYLSIRVWYDVSKGQATNWRPSHKGITLPIDLLQELKTGINKASKLIDSDKPEKGDAEKTS